VPAQAGSHGSGRDGGGERGEPRARARDRARVCRAGRGAIRNIRSTGVCAPLPFCSVYRSSKADIAAISEALRIELAPFGIRVTGIPTGNVDRAPFRTDVARRPAEAIDGAPYRPTAERHCGLNRQRQGRATGCEGSARRVADAICAEVGPLGWACAAGARAALDLTRVDELVEAWQRA
jgi:NAD(P)-dependent dehydrogenase (short-subunit alcohol dehydrogenase family)